MKKKYYFICLTAIILKLSSIVWSIFLNPGILEPPPANKVICQDQQIDNSVTRNSDREPTPYFQCVNEAFVKIMTASFQESTVNSCPLQFAREQPVKTCTTNNYANANVTVMMKRLCDGKQRCVFSFSQLPRFLCVLDSTSNQVIDSRFTNINITYFCQLPRRRFRPFTNKRYNYKFSRTFNHPFRKLSYNRLQTL